MFSRNIIKAYSIKEKKAQSSSDGVVTGKWSHEATEIQPFVNLTQPGAFLKVHVKA